MGAIRTSIVINDGMSPALRSMNKALNIVMNSFQAMQAAVASPVDDAAFQAAREELAHVSVALDEAEEQARRAQEAQRDYTEEVNRSSTAAERLAGTVKRLAGTYATIQTAQKAIEKADEWTQTSARLSMMAREGERVDEIQQKIFASANRARAAYMETADAVAKIGLRAGDAFGSTDEIIAFSETLNKMYVIAGASQAEQASSMQQLTQALGSGVLRGEEFNAVFEAAPNIMQEIADYMGVPIGALREVASEGQITADIVRLAILSASEEINEEFASMPATFGQAFNLFSNQAMMALEPVWLMLGEISSSDDFLAFANGAGQALAVVAGAAVTVLDILSSVAGFTADHWDTIGPIIYGVVGALAVYAAYLAITKGLELASAAGSAAMAVGKGFLAAATVMTTSATWAQTTAQMGLNGAMYACPLVWIIMLIIALIAVIFAVCGAIAEMTGVTESGFGLICGIVLMAGAFILNAAIGLVNAIIQCFWNQFVSPFIGIIEWVLNAANGGFDSFGDAVANLIGQIIGWFLSLGKVVTTIIDAIFGTDWTAGLNSLQESVTSWGKNENAVTLEREAPKIDYRFEYGDAFETGAAWGDGVSENIANTFSAGDSISNAYGADYEDTLTGIGSGVAETADNTGRDLDISEENLKYMRDLAEQEAVNRFTTAEIRVDMVNNNSVSSSMDLDGMVDYLVTGVQTSMEQAAEGVHE